jgi:Fe-S cluster biogenesis protein NfuA
MFIQIEKTADPDRMHFLPGRAVLDGGSEIAFSDAGDAGRSPLASRLFEIEGIEAITLGADHVGVGKAAAADWQVLKPVVLGVIMEHFITATPVLLTDDRAADEIDPADAEAAAAISELIETRIRPRLEYEGGDVSFRGFRGGVVELELLGSGFAVPVFSIRVRIENTLRHHIPEIEEVRFVEAARRASDAEGLDLGDPTVAAVHTLLEERINPSVAAHGGHIALIDVKESTAYIRLEGGCQGCGMADVTLKQGVERAILEAVPGITAVRDVTDHDGGANPYYQPGKEGAAPF